MESQNKFPVACTDDLPSSDQSSVQNSGMAASATTATPPTPAFAQYQTATVSPAGQLTSQNLQMDAARECPSAGSHRQLPARRGDVERIEIKDGNKSIVMEGVMQALQPGVNVQIGSNVSMTVNQYRGHGPAVTTLSNKPSAQRPLGQHKVTDSRANPSSEQLRLIGDQLSTEWRNLGYVLGITESSLDQIYLDYNAQGQREVNHQILRRWRQQICQENYTVQALAQALANIGRLDLADMLGNSL